MEIVVEQSEATDDNDDFTAASAGWGALADEVSCEDANMSDVHSVPSEFRKLRVLQAWAVN
jgi:hypothetical protein